MTSLFSPLLGIQTNPTMTRQTVSVDEQHAAIKIIARIIIIGYISSQGLRDDLAQIDW
jgi:hypothetical protein